MLVHPRENKYSSSNYYTYGQEDPLITPAPTYLGVGNTPRKRQKVYRELVETILMSDWRDKISYSSMLFIGDPDWVKVRVEHLKSIKREKYQRYKQNKMDRKQIQSQI